MGFATSMAVAATAAAAGSVLLSAKAEADDFEAQGELQDYNAAVKENDAIAMGFKTRFDQIREVLEGGRRIGRLRARLLGKSGAIGKAPELAEYEQAAENALSVATIGYRGMVEQSRLRSEAMGLREAASFSRHRGRSAERRGFLDAGTAILGGVTSMSQAGMFTPKAATSATPRTPKPSTFRGFLGARQSTPALRAHRSRYRFR